MSARTRQSNWGKLIFFRLPGENQNQKPWFCRKWRRIPDEIWSLYRVAAIIVDQLALTVSARCQKDLTTRQHCFRENYLTVHLSKPIHKFATQLMAWSAVVMLFLQPLVLNGDDCGCGAGNEPAAAMATLLFGQCSGKKMLRAAKSSCCTASNELPDTSCKCGDQCRCSVNEPGKPLPVVPANESQNEQTQSLALTNCVESVIVFKTECKLDCQSFSVVSTSTHGATNVRPSLAFHCLDLF